jgi:hypothetical protein
MTFSYDFTWDYFPLFVQSGLTAANTVSSNFSITVYPYWFKQITLEWVVPTDWGSCRFNVYKAQTEDGPFTKLNQAPLEVGTNFFKDTTTQDFSKIYRSWYIVEAVLSTGKRIQSEPQTWGNKRLPWVELRSQEIQRREWLLLNKFTGSECYSLRRRTYGKRCSNCWNFDLEKCTIDKCIVCMGTSFEGGYFPAARTLMQFDADPDQIVLEYFGKWEVNETFSWTIAFPEVRQRDLIYRVMDNSLFEISDRKETTLQSVAVRQLLKVIELDRESPEFQAILNNNLIPSRYQT